MAISFGFGCLCFDKVTCARMSIGCSDPWAWLFPVWFWLRPCEKVLYLSLKVLDWNYLPLCPFVPCFAHQPGRWSGGGSLEVDGRKAGMLRRRGSGGGGAAVRSGLLLPLISLLFSISRLLDLTCRIYHETSREDREEGKDKGSQRPRLRTELARWEGTCSSASPVSLSSPRPTSPWRQCEVLEVVMPKSIRNLEEI
jgi:hypothetical protein